MRKSPATSKKNGAACESAMRKNGQTVLAQLELSRLRSSMLPGFAREDFPDHRGPSKNKRPLKIKEQLQNKRHDVAYFLVYQWIGEARAARSAYFLK